MIFPLWKYIGELTHLTILCWSRAIHLIYNIRDFRRAHRVFTGYYHNAHYRKLFSCDSFIFWPSAQASQFLKWNSLTLMHSTVVRPGPCRRRSVHIPAIPRGLPSMATGRGGKTAAAVRAASNRAGEDGLATTEQSIALAPPVSSRPYFPHLIRGWYIPPG